MIYERMTCRLCDGPVKVVLSLTPTPIANNYAAKPDEQAERYPLALAQCLQCAHVQLRHVITGLFTDYKYETPDEAMPHLRLAAAKLREQYPNARTVLEIGSNNGLNLHVLRERGFMVTGVDPAAQIPLDLDEIRAEFGKDVVQQFSAVDLIVANNVFAHIDDLRGVFEAAVIALKDDGAIVFEVQHLPDLIRAGAFDMIYHEHLDYHTLPPLARFARSVGLVMTDYEHLAAHGGSIRVTMKKHGEEKMHNQVHIDWRRFELEIERQVRNVVDKLNGKRVPMFGAPAKATTLLHHCGIAKNIDYAVDCTIPKQGRYIPGTDISIVPEAGFLPPEEMFLATWNYHEAIQAKYPNVRFISAHA